MRLGNPTSFLTDFFKRADKEMAKLSTAQLETLINTELENRRRPSVLTRLHRRFSIMRSQDERARLKKGVVTWKG